MLPDWQPEAVLVQSTGSSSPQSQELQNFEAYNRRVLPQIVEASLSAAISTDLAPVEERVRALVGDILRTCQSTVFRNFQRMNTTNPPNPNVTASPIPHEGPNPVPIDDGENPFDTVGSSTSTSLFFQEPPHLNFDEGTTNFQSTPESNVLIPVNSQGSDSGYGSLPKGCECSCHLAPSDPSHPSSTSSKVNREDAISSDLAQSQGCFSCSSKHADQDQNVPLASNDIVEDFDLEQWLNSEGVS